MSDSSPLKLPPLQQTELDPATLDQLFADLAECATVLAVVLIAVIIWDAFEALVLPRRVTRRLRPTRFFYRTTWRGWSSSRPSTRPRR